MGQNSLTVLMPNYNHGHFIREALESVFSQSRPPSEVIVVDDGSTDDSWALLERLAKEHPTLRIARNERNMGGFHTVNKLLGMATGDYLHCLAADDKTLPGLYEKSMAMLERHPEAALSASLEMVMDEDGSNMRPLATPVVSAQACYIPPRQALEFFDRFGSWMVPHAVLFKRALGKEMGMYDPALLHAQEGFWNLAMIARQGMCFIPEPLVVWRQCPGSYASVVNKDFRESMDVVQRHFAWLRGKHGDFFPPGFLDRWARWQYSGMVHGRFLMEPQRHEHLAQLMEAIPGPARTLSDRLLLFAMRRLSPLTWLSVKLYLFAQLPFSAQLGSVLRKISRSSARSGG